MSQGIMMTMLFLFLLTVIENMEKHIDIAEEDGYWHTNMTEPTSMTVTDFTTATSTATGICSKGSSTDTTGTIAIVTE